MPLTATAGPIPAFIESMGAALAEDAARGMTPPIERRKLRTITAECRRRGSAHFFETLDLRLREAGIYTDPPLVDSGLRLDDWVLFSTGPFPPDSSFFPKEKDLKRFVEACLGSGVFRNLELCKLPGRQSGREFRLPDGRKIDLLCQERTRSGNGALVAIELKCEHERGTVEQLISYLDALKDIYPSRDVKGIIISGRENQVASAVLRNMTGYDIKWFCYQVTFNRLATA